MPTRKKNNTRSIQKSGKNGLKRIKLLNHKKNKSINIRNKQINRKHKIIKGGTIDLFNYTQHGIPEPTTLLQVTITDEHLCNFRRFIGSPMDCLINAIQLMGLIESKEANLLRISAAGTAGFSIEQISSIFILYTHKFCLFKQTNDFNIFGTQLTKMLPGTVALGGYSGGGFSHVFLIGKSLNGTMVYIDPQQEVNTFCNLSEEQCVNTLKNKDAYYLLYHNNVNLTAQQLHALGFIEQQRYPERCTTPVSVSTYQQPTGMTQLPPNPVYIQQQIEQSVGSDLTLQDINDGMIMDIDDDL